MFKQPYLEPGTTHTRLTILRPLGPNVSRSKFLCLCTCGKVKAIGGINIKNNKSKSCGCLRTENLRREHAKFVIKQRGY
jgi:hypothetical protein